MRLDPTDRAIIAASTRGLPLLPEPYETLAGQLHLSQEELLDRMNSMKERGIIRRVALAPNHYALGMVANGMSVWDVPDDVVDNLGQRVGALDFVSHCYLRPRSLPDWTYNLFAMIHGHSRDEVEEKRQTIAGLLGEACRAHDVLYSTRILKKTGFRTNHARR